MRHALLSFRESNERQQCHLRQRARITPILKIEVGLRGVDRVSSALVVALTGAAATALVDEPAQLLDWFSSPALVHGNVYYALSRRLWR
jgi:hypothetical protein